MTGLREDHEWRRKARSEQVRVGRGLKREQRGSEGPSVCKFTPRVSWVRYPGVWEVGEALDPLGPVVEVKSKLLSIRGHSNQPFNQVLEGRTSPRYVGRFISDTGSPLSWRPSAGKLGFTGWHS